MYVRTFSSQSVVCEKDASLVYSMRCTIRYLK